MTSYRTALERFTEKYSVKEDGCWTWEAATTSLGYGMFHAGEGTNEKIMAHRWAYEHYIGDIAPGLELDHLCRVRNCVNPQHLEPVTPSENTRRGYESRSGGRASTCANGHEVSGDNRYVQANGKSRCRACNNAKNAERNRARRIAQRA